MIGLGPRMTLRCDQGAGERTERSRYGGRQHRHVQSVPGVRNAHMRSRALRVRWGNDRERRVVNRALGAADARHWTDTRNALEWVPERRAAGPSTGSECPFARRSA